MNLRRLSIFAERLWLTIAIASFIFWLYKYYTSNFYESRTFLFIAVFSFIFFVVRQGLRKSFDRRQERESGDNQP